MNAKALMRVLPRGEFVRSSDRRGRVPGLAMAEAIAAPEARVAVRAVAPPWRVVHVTTVASSLGFLKGQVEHLRARGHEVWAVAAPGPLLDAFGRRARIPVLGIAMARRITPLADLASVARLWKFFRRVRPHIVHGHTPKGGLLAMIAAALAGVPVRFYTVHGLPLETASGWKRTLLRWTERVSAGLAHRVHPVSDSLGRLVLEEKLCPPRRLFRLGPGTIDGVDAEGKFAPGGLSICGGLALRRRLGIPPLAPVVGFVGRIVRDKGVVDLVEAWNILRDEIPAAHLVLAGTFEAHDPVPPEVERTLRNDPRIHLLGQVASMPAVYGAMDVLALPTYREGFPQTPLEAAAMEIPVVATRVTGCVDAVVHGETGTLIPPRSPRVLAAALEAYLRRPRLRRRHGLAARRRVLDRFQPGAFRSAMEEGYRGELGRRAGAERDRSRSGKFGSRRPLSARKVELLIKRLMDIAGAAAGLALLFPVLLLIGLGTWLTLGRPLFFRQVRPGLKGKPFTPFKFRTMRPGPEHDDFRVTRLGRFLRHFSLDELPQLWNVLIGDMSLVGPRPLLMAYLKRYSPRLRQRHDVRPGVTGWCQINGRNSLTWDRKFAFDVWYVEHWSLALDLKILFLTVGRILRRSGIEGPGSHCWPEDMTGPFESPLDDPGEDR